jgi:hypothetical protein
MPYTVALLSDDEYGPRIRELVRQADTGIEDLTREDLDNEQLLERLSVVGRQIPQELRFLIQQQASAKAIVRTIHRKFGGGNSPAGEVEFDLSTEESDGTRQFFGLAGPFLRTLGEGAVLVVDELDAHLHPLLTRQLVALFNSSANRKNAQLIFATHDQGLLDRKRIRRDQVWFVEKDAMGASSLFCLDEFRGVRKDDNFEKEYLLGIFGGVPRLGDFEKALLHGKE